MRSTILPLVVAFFSLSAFSPCEAAIIKEGPAAAENSKRADVVLADGTSMQYSTAPLANGLSWQASGFLEKGGCSSDKQYITDCYEMRHVADPTQNLDPNAATPRQRTEFLTAHQPDGSKWKYAWRSYIPSYDTGSTSFFHLMQIFSTADSGPVYFMDIIKDMVYVKDVAAGTYLASATLADFSNRPLLHTMTITYGPSGSVQFAITDSQTGAAVLSFSKSGGIGSDGTYLKFGMYRATYDGEPSTKAWYGDFVQTQLA
ncbi:hypothetical protein DL93DRAFT_1117928 [Clavulina sp. PMI_390]|nr:hypothetical protein DL93DRAFT_1117928 [Clavulina sp. PMI_390]